MGLTKPRASQIFDIDYKQATRVITVSDVALAGGAPSQVDGVNLAEDDRVLVSGQSTASQNGLYFVSSLGTGANGTWLRTSDGNENGEVQAGMIVMVTEGSLYHDTQWKLTTNNPIVIGTTALTFVINILSQIGGSNTQIQYNNAGTMGGSANLTWDGTTLYTNGAVSATGNITGNYILGNGSQLSGVITTVDANTLTGNTLSSNVVNSSLTSVGTLGNLSVTGNITGSYILGNGSQLTGVEAGLSWTTVANTAPSNANPGDFWYNSYTGIKYQYTNDGTSNIWIDQSFPTSFATITVSGNISGGNLLTGGIVSATGDITSSGNVTALNFNSSSADLAENYEADALYTPGTVVVFGGTKEITISNRSHDTAVAGIVSTSPSYLMNVAQTGAWILPVALTGRVPCQVQGPVSKGDVLVTSSQPGTAQRIGNNYQPGCVVGKSLEVITGDTMEIIEVAVGRF